MLQIAVLTIFPLAMLVAASMDLFTMTIPNRISLALVAGFLALAPFIGMSWGDFALHLATAAGLLVLGMGMFAMGWMGGGDAKLLAATGLWFGYGTLLYQYAVLAAIFGAVLTLAIVLYRQLPIGPLLAPFPWALRLHDRKEGVPYGVSLALAGLLIYPSTIWMTGVS
jgi:prepilin peptidase CpaA